MGVEIGEVEEEEVGEAEIEAASGRNQRDGFSRRRIDRSRQRWHDEESSGKGFVASNIGNAG
jgi:hypothetical protein